MDSAALRPLVLKLVEGQTELAAQAKNKESNVIIVILKHDARASSDLDVESFVWVKAKTTTKGHRIKKAYIDRYGGGDPTLSINLKYGDLVLDDDMKAGTFSDPQDGIIVLTAEREAPAVVPPPIPAVSLSGFLETNDDYLARGSISTASPIRMPLQPVNRQLTVPPHSSGEEVLPKIKSSPRSTPLSNDLPERFHPPTTPNGRRSADDTTTTIPVETPRQRQGPEFPLRDSQDSPEAFNQEYKSRKDATPFTGSIDEQQAFARGAPLRSLAQDELPEKLEAAVKAGVDMLARLREPLEQMPHLPDSQNWLDQIQKVCSEAVKTRTVVGVVGNTGAGKSSVINAMLDEERLVPTNCMRACTAVVTEMSYNYSNVENARYRAEIEFIQAEDWRKELEVLFQEVFDESGHMTREVHNADSQAGIAYAKIRGVYHKHTNEMLSNASVNSLMATKMVANMLGTIRRIQAKLPGDFYKQLQQYVASVETIKLDKNGNRATNQKREFQFWPLIKVVRIYTKADALSKGSVVVDLPGVHDSNAARAAVAEGYMKSCTGLWIVAPITRAVDDKAAKTLLGNTFRRQLKYDGIYSAVTFICSKTDDISRMEATDSLRLGSEMSEIEDKLSTLTKQRREYTEEQKSARASKRDYAETIEDIEEQIERFEQLQEQVEDGGTVFAPATGSKRKRSSASPQSRKKQRRDLMSDDDDRSPDDQGNTSKGYMTTSEEPLSEAQIEEKLVELKHLKKEARRERNKIDERLREIGDNIREIEQREDKLDAETSALCIAARNKYSRGAIRRDFAAGIRELDQENAEEEDPDNFNPEEDLRDYDEVASSLPVFCVSSRAYQNLSGRMLKDNQVAGFTTKESTEIPQLQAHCKKLTEKGRQATCRRFLNTLNQLLNSLSLWSSDDGTGAKLTNHQRDAEKGFLDRRLKELEKALETAVGTALDNCIANLDEQLYEKFGPAADAAAAIATTTSDGWGAHRNDGGLIWATYKATVRRAGVFSGAAGHRDFNTALSDPMLKHLASAWEKVFQRRLPHILRAFTKSASDLLKKFHAAIEARCLDKGHGVAQIGRLGGQLNGYQAVFGDLANAMVAQVNEAQRNINREFAPAIAATMEPAYEFCISESGQGSFKRMKTHMHSHVDDAKSSMFVDACDQIRKSLRNTCEEIRKTMLDRADGVYMNMQRDYMSIIGGVNVGQVSMPREERSIRRQLDEMITEADTQFQVIIDCEDPTELDVLEEAKEDKFGVVDDHVQEYNESDSDDEEEAKSGDEVESEETKLEEEVKSEVEVQAEQDAEF